MACTTGQAPALGKYSNISPPPPPLAQTSDLLGCSCVGDGIAGGVEGNEEGIPFCGNLIPAILGHVHAHHTIMQADGLHHGLVVPLPHLCAALHVRAHKRDAGLSCRRRRRRRRSKSWSQALARLFQSWQQIVEQQYMLGQ